ncbi:MAG: TIGR00701 family protein [Alphaproteobacteria bacterium]|nr:MAG: TIGR00701 family protein [Alphaproteobacteria bacterium]
MQDFLINHYLWIKAFHIISVISWMAAMLYLPRLFIYHCDSKIGSKQSETFKIMEYRLLRYICNPAMIATFIFGGLMIFANPDLMTEGWLHTKLTLLFLLSGFHGLCSKWRKAFQADQNKKSPKFFRIANEVPTFFMIVIVILAVVKPF